MNFKSIVFDFSNYVYSSVKSNEAYPK